MELWNSTWARETMLRLETRLDQQRQAMFHDLQPDCCPTDPIEKHKYFSALALLALLDGHGGRPGKPEVIVVIDQTQPDRDGRPAVDWGLPVELPERVLADLCSRAKTYTVVVRNGAVINAGGELDQGRASRQPNRA